jgi:hypothetical protein
VPIKGTTTIRFKLLSTRELSYTIMIRKFFFFILSIITFLGEHGLLLGVSTLMIFTRRDLYLSITWMQPLNIMRFTLPTGACTPQLAQALMGLDHFSTKPLGTLFLVILLLFLKLSTPTLLI